MNGLGEKLKLLRTQRCLTMPELSKYLDVNKSTLSRYESNEIQPSLDNIVKLSKYYNISTDWLLGIKDK